MELLKQDCIFRFFKNCPSTYYIRHFELKGYGFIELDFNPKTLKQEKTYFFYKEKWFKKQLKSVQFQINLDLFQNDEDGRSDGLSQKIEIERSKSGEQFVLLDLKEP
jgi:hypothetical protein